MINYCDQLSKFIVYGTGISGLSTAKFIASRLSNEIIITDDNPQNLILTQEKLANFEFFDKFIFKNPSQLNFDSNTVIIASPGINFTNPPHPIFSKALQFNAKIICDIELFCHLNKQQNFIAITGTNGKSTTAALTNHILNEIGVNSQLGGNIGVACFDLMQNPESNLNYVFEVSSFQIDLLKQAKFNIAALLNISEDHLDRYQKFEKYIDSKSRIFINQNDKDYAIINVDDEICRKLYYKLNQTNISNIVAISQNNNLDKNYNFVSLIHNKIRYNINGYFFESSINPKFIKGKHNFENIAFACASVLCLLIFKKNCQIDQKIIEKISQSVETFKGLNHRLQFVGKINDISFYNDSKATNANSTSHALQAFDDIFWIVGGKAKSDGITPLIPFFKKIKKAYLIGQSSEEFAKVLSDNNVEFEFCNILETATKKAFLDAKNCRLSQKTILLSPACASFDQWQNFEQRGNYFCKIFDEINKE